jgi:hypothetical protein
MAELQGDRMHPGDSNYGITLACINDKCSAQEVMGHGNKIKDAWDVVNTKFNRKKNP